MHIVHKSAETIQGQKIFEEIWYMIDLRLMKLQKNKGISGIFMLPFPPPI